MNAESVRAMRVAQELRIESARAKLQADAKAEWDAGGGYDLKAVEAELQRRREKLRRARRDANDFADRNLRCWREAKLAALRKVLFSFPGLQ